MTEKIGFWFLNQDILQYNDEQTWQVSKKSSGELKVHI